MILQFKFFVEQLLMKKMFKKRQKKTKIEDNVWKYLFRFQLCQQDKF